MARILQTQEECKRAIRPNNSILHFRSQGDARITAKRLAVWSQWTTPVFLSLPDIDLPKSYHVLHQNDPPWAHARIKQLNLPSPSMLTILNKSHVPC